MNRYAIIQDNIVINIIIWDGQSQWIHPEGTQLIQSDSLNIGDTYSPGQ
jgi:hypothetical protein